MTIEFAGIIGVARDGNVVRLGGRVYQGPIRVGDTFTTLRAESGEENSVRLTVESIELYGHQLDEAEAVMTPALTLSGDGIGLLSEGALLAG